VLTSDQTSRLVRLDGLEEMGWKGTSLAGPSAVSPDGRWLAIFSPFSTSLRVYRFPGLEQVAELENEFKIAGFEFSPSGDEIAVATAERIELWSTATWKRIGEIPNFKEARYAPNERAWWLTSDSRSAGLYDAVTRQPLLPLPTGMLPLATSPDGRFLAVSVDGRRLQVWDLGKLRLRLRELGIDWRSN